MMNGPKIVTIEADLNITVENPTGGHDQRRQPDSWIHQSMILATGAYLCLTQYNVREIPGVEVQGDRPPN